MISQYHNDVLIITLSVTKTKMDATLKSPPRFVFFGIDCSAVPFTEPQDESGREALEFYETSRLRAKSFPPLPGGTPVGFAKFREHFTHSSIFTESLVTALKETLARDVDATEFGSLRTDILPGHDSWTGFTFSVRKGVVKGCSVSYMYRRPQDTSDAGDAETMYVCIECCLERIFLEVHFTTPIAEKVSCRIKYHRGLELTDQFVKQMKYASFMFVCKSVTCDADKGTMTFERVPRKDEEGDGIW